MNPADQFSQSPLVQLSADEQAQASRNFRAFIAILIEWEEADRAERAQRVIESLTEK